jgi:hypothetical protein
VVETIPTYVVYMTIIKIYFDFQQSQGAIPDSFLEEWQVLRQNGRLSGSSLVREQEIP